MGARDYFVYGLVFSLTGHALLFIAMIYGGFWRLPEDGPEIIYSITLESGQKLGGVTQLPVANKDSAAAPPKVAQDSEPEKQAEPAKIDSAKAEPAKPDVKKEEVVNIAEPTKIPATPLPTPKNTAAPVPTKKVTPTKKPTAKAKEPSLAEINKQLEKALQRYTGESTDAGGKGFGAGKLGAKGMGGGVLQPPEFFRYRELLEYHVKKEWRWYDTTSALTARVSFKISPDGKLGDVEVASSSGNREFDESAVRAVYKSDPAPPPPESVYHLFKEVRMTFDPRQ